MDRPTTATHATRISDQAEDRPPPLTVIERAFGDEPLSPEDERTVARMCYGFSGPGAGTHVITHSGWRWDLSEAAQIRRFIARTGERWSVYHAPFRQSLLHALRCNAGPNVEEIYRIGDGAGVPACA